MILSIGILLTTTALLFKSKLTIDKIYLKGTWSIVVK